MVFITAGMGGGTGTGSAHVIARAAKELNILTVGVAILPFLYEGPSRTRRAQSGLEELRKHVDTTIVVPNQNLFKIASEQTNSKNPSNYQMMFLLHRVQSITDLMVRPGLINLDFADVETVMSSMGKAMMGTGEAEGEGRATKAAEMAINNPLIDDYTLKGAKGLLVNITGGKDLKLFEVDEAVNKVRAEVDTEAELIIGAITDPELDGKMRVSIVATALDGQQPEAKSVINMVHRIHNRNPGYSDFSNLGSNNQMNISNNQNHITEGATALKLENEVSVEAETMNEGNLKSDYSAIASSELLNEIESQNSETVNNLENVPNTSVEEKSPNGLENFGIDEIEESVPDLFNSEKPETSEQFTSFENKEESNDEDELEIPALRRQKS